MRLIDADALTIVSEWDENATVWHDYYERFEVDEAPTVDAIPVEWIERFLAEREMDKWSDEPQSEYWLRIDQEINDIESMVTHWMNTEGKEE